MPNMLDLDTRFSQQPQANVSRSIVPRKSDVKTTFNYGDLIPVYVDEILPGQSSKMSIGSLVRMSTPMFPVMDSSYMDLYAFFVPNRLVWDHWEQFMGENKDSAWVSEETYSIPTLYMDDFPDEYFSEGSLMDYMGLPTEVYFADDPYISALPFRAYALIWNEWYRDQNYQNPLRLNTGDDDEDNRVNGVYAVQKVNKLHDLFTSVLPEPQKGSSVSLTFNGGLAPVYTVFDDYRPMDDEQFLKAWAARNGDVEAPDLPRLNFITERGNITSNTVLSVGGAYNADVVGGVAHRAIGYKEAEDLGNVSATTPVYGIMQQYADLNYASISTINQLRNAIVVQQYLERLASGGSRYTEILRSLFGVISPDARLQRPELLGHIRMDINMQQVIQTSFQGGEAQTTPLGSTGAYSKTTDFNFMYEKSFVEHGHILILACARTELSYQQGIERMWTRRTVTDFYNPIFANIGNQPVEMKRIYCAGNHEDDDQVFGYQEAWAEYRYKTNKVCGRFRTNSAAPLDAWHYAQWFDDTPYMGDDFLKQGTSEVSRTLVVENEPQLLCNFFFDEVATLPMPVYSIPGLDVL